MPPHNLPLHPARHRHPVVRLGRLQRRLGARRQRRRRPGAHQHLPRRLRRHARLARSSRRSRTATPPPSAPRRVRSPAWSPSRRAPASSAAWRRSDHRRRRRRRLLPRPRHQEGVQARRQPRRHRRAPRRRPRRLDRCSASSPTRRSTPPSPTTGLFLGGGGTELLKDQVVAAVGDARLLLRGQPRHRQGDRHDHRPAGRRGDRGQRPRPDPARRDRVQRPLNQTRETSERIDHEAHHRNHQAVQARRGQGRAQGRRHRRHDRRPRSRASAARPATPRSTGAPSTRSTSCRRSASSSSSTTTEVERRRRRRSSTAARTGKIGDGKIWVTDGRAGHPHPHRRAGHRRHLTIPAPVHGPARAPVRWMRDTRLPVPRPSAGAGACRFRPWPPAGGVRRRRRRRGPPGPRAGAGPAARGRGPPPGPRTAASPGVTSSTVIPPGPMPTSHSPSASVACRWTVAGWPPSSVQRDDASSRSSPMPSTATRPAPV